MTRVSRRHSAMFALLSTLACGGQTLDVGSNGHTGAISQGGANGAAGTSGGGSEAIASGPSLPTWPALAGCEDTPTSLTGSWSGYIEGPLGNKIPNDGNFEVSFLGGGDAPCGTIRFGEPIELAPATDPTAPYPPGYTETKALRLVAGYSYTLLDTSLDGAHLQFRLSLAEPWRSWCALQTSYLDETNGAGYSCVRNLGYTSQNGACVQTDAQGNKITLSCYQADLCLNESACQCDATGCQPPLDSPGSPRFDLHVTGGDAQGAISQFSEQRTVYLTQE